MTAALTTKNGLKNATVQDTATTWHAFLRLKLEKRKQLSALTSAHHKGPLRVQKPFYPEGKDLAHIYVLHPPGGMVSGDSLNISATLKSDAHALFTAPGAGRAYQARQDGILQQQNITLQAEAGASIEWLPPENIMYPGACALLNTQVSLAKNSHYIGWEITSLGLPVQNAAFTQGEFTQKLAICQDEKPVFLERFCINNDTRYLLNSKSGLQGYPIQGTLVAGPFPDQTILQETLTQCRALSQSCFTPKTADELPCYNSQYIPLSGATSINNFFVLRSLGHCSDAMKTLFVQQWSIIRPALLNRAACPPRIWAT